MSKTLRLRLKELESKVNANKEKCVQQDGTVRYLVHSEVMKLYFKIITGEVQLQSAYVQPPMLAIASVRQLNEEIWA